MTYSIVARCPETGMLAVGIATCLPSVGRIARFVEPGVGAVASQAQLLPAHGTRVLEGMRGGATPADALAASLALDDGAEHRQVGVVAADGTTAGYTGSSCIREASHLTGDGWSVQANMMLNRGVPEAMAEAFESSVGEHIALRVLAALDAAEARGGDIRGRQSAAILVRGATETGSLLDDQPVDARVDDDPEPLVPLRAVVRTHLAYQESVALDRAFVEGDPEAAAAHLRVARDLAPHDDQIPLGYAMEAVAAGDEAAAREVWAEVLGRPGGEKWVDLLARMVEAGLVPAKTAAVLDEGQRRS